ncbi:hypothetical protein JX265_001464 [Neoarthrinium moseri]|uniref:Uncharacterized protein n=1 Tax=Neoarthrinium moseri TaxID=1658444 RepID=A0A9Q0AUM3_9PEZI|nr:uncharacterized protein JN550_009887 [Neoarthrinium moseri]KAI1842175.1 hypothetical protein JX266_011583 [Neoarthrinium moseri]KAI1863151.1 hypothetical protein JN550_009887 [Neoarthrinium moseri]KAI1879843.1 hypothetical protein JX265_001464 [Neoarthrinium moseri]
MPNSSGRIAGDMKWHIYRYPSKPGTLMSLGTILTQPDNLEEPLHVPSGTGPFLPHQLLDQTDAVQRVIRSELTNKFGTQLQAVLPINPFISAGGGAETQWSKSRAVTAEALGISARVLRPDAAREYLEAQLSLPKIVRYVREGFFAKSLYVIVGVATAKKFYLSETLSSERAASVEGKVQFPMAGVDVGVGPSVSMVEERGSDADIQGECDFAYRVREFVYSKRKKQIKDKSTDFVKGTLFGLDEGVELDAGFELRGRVSPQAFLPAEGDAKTMEEFPVLDYIEDYDEEFGDNDSSFTT